MLKSPLTSCVIAATLLYAGLLNIVHGYEHDEVEQHSVECEVCTHLSKISDSIPVGSVIPTYAFSEVENYLFIVKNNFSPSTYIVHPRAPPQAQTFT